MWKKILGINLLVFALYVVLININSSTADKGFNIAIGMGVCVVLHVVINGLAGLVFLVMGKRELFPSFFISAAVLGFAGFITWLVLLSIFG